MQAVLVTGYRMLQLRGVHSRRHSWRGVSVMRTVDEERHVHKDLGGVRAPHHLRRQRVQVSSARRLKLLNYVYRFHTGMQKRS